MSPFELLLTRIRGEYREMPGLRLTFAQACRLWQVDAATCEMVVHALLAERFIGRTADGAFVAFSARPGHPDPPAGRRAVVVLVQRDDDGRDMYGEYLRTCGFTVVASASADEGFKDAAEADVAVTGIRVPGTFDGVELVRRLRAAERTRQMTIVVLTACAFELDRQRAHAAGCDVFLPKPCLPDVLVREIYRALALRRVSRPQPARASHETPRRHRRQS